MNKKTLLSKLLLAGMSTASVSASCTNGGFAVGTKAGVNFAKVKFKAEEDGVKLKKTLLPIELFCGYAARINDVMLGLDVGFGTHIGKLKKTWKNNDRNKIEFIAKNTWYIDAKPRVGYLVTSETEIYATGGIRLGKYKTSVTDVASAKTTKVSGLLGAGARYTFTGGFFLGGEYLYQISTKPKLPKSVKATAKLSGHTIGLVCGISF